MSSRSVRVDISLGTNASLRGARESKHAHRNAIHTVALVSMVLVVSCVVASCAVTEERTGDTKSCQGPAATPYLHYVSIKSQPPWATLWKQPLLAASARVAVTDEASDEQLVSVAMSCAGLADLLWDYTEPKIGVVKPIDVVVGVQHYLYEATKAEQGGNRFIIAIVLKRINDSSAAFAVQAMTVDGDFPAVQPDGASVVQPLRSAGLL